MKPMRSVVLRDSTLREGLDVPGLFFTEDQQGLLAAELARLGIREIEIGAPGRLREALRLHARIKSAGLPLGTSGLVFGYGPVREQLGFARGLDRADILMPLVGRGPRGEAAKLKSLREALGSARAMGLKDYGAGFPHATLAERDLLLRAAKTAKSFGASRVILYDTNGAATPDQIAELTRLLRPILPVHVHCHNDLGLALANSLAAVDAGASFVDCTFHGIGDRAGNCPLEPLALHLALKKVRHGLTLRRLKAASDLAAGITRLRGPLFPVTGEFAFAHSTRTHLRHPALFEPIDPGKVGAARTVLPRPGAVLWNDRARVVSEVLNSRRSVRRFQDRPVPLRMLRRLCEAACRAPSSMNGRPWSFLLVRDRSLLARIAEIKNRHLPAEKRDFPADFVARAPCAIVVCMDKRSSFGREVENAALASANIMVLAQAGGLGTTFLTAGRDGDPILESELRQALDLGDGDIRPCAILPLGYPAQEPGSRACARVSPKISCR